MCQRSPACPATRCRNVMLATADHESEKLDKLSEKPGLLTHSRMAMEFKDRGEQSGILVVAHLHRRSAAAGGLAHCPALPAGAGRRNSASAAACSSLQLHPCQGALGEAGGHGYVC